MSRERFDQIGRKIVIASIEVHRELGPGLLESVYEHCLSHELEKQDLYVDRQVHLPLMYKGEEVGKYFVLDMLVENSIILELKAVEMLLPVDEVQLVTYLKLADKRLGYLLNFNVPLLKEGIKRKVHLLPSF